MTTRMLIASEEWWREATRRLAERVRLLHSSDPVVQNLRQCLGELIVLVREVKLEEEKMAVVKYGEIDMAEPLQPYTKHTADLLREVLSAADKNRELGPSLRLLVEATARMSGPRLLRELGFQEE